MSNTDVVLKDLGRLVSNCVAKYNAEFVWQDVKLSDEFRFEFSSCISRGGGTITFLDYSAIVTTSKNRQIFAPNQWFVIASYAVELCLELKKYQSLYFKVADSLTEDYEDFAKKLRGYNEGVELKNRFVLAASDIILENSDCGETESNLAALQLWRFCTDYQWWGGQKTIDRGDFMNSTVLSLLNLVAASQGFVADIVYYYINDSALCELVNSPEDFTIDLEISQAMPSGRITAGYDIYNDGEARELHDDNTPAYGKEQEEESVPTQETSVHRIKISSLSWGKFNKN